MHLPRHLWTMRNALLAGLGLFLLVQSLREPHFWITADQKGSRLFHQGRYAEAAKAFTDPWWIATSQYRHGDFEVAAKTFARVPGAKGAYDQGNAWLMNGKYDAAIASYDRALGFQPGWKEAEENKALAVARKQRLDASGKDRDQESTEAYKPDEIVFDQKGEDKQGKPMELGSEKMSDDELRASWLRRVQTTPSDFLKAKFASQAASSAKAEERPRE